MLARHPLAELAPRDIVARGVFAEIAAGRGAFLDAREALGARFAEKFPTVHASCIAAGIDPATQPIPVAPAAHYHMGGIAVDARGRTSLEGPVGRRRSVVDRRAWRQPAGVELAAGGRGLCRAHRRGHRRPAASPRPPACRRRRSIAAQSRHAARCRKQTCATMMTSHVGVIRDGDAAGGSGARRSRTSSATPAISRCATWRPRRCWSRPRPGRGAKAAARTTASTIRPKIPALAHRTMTTLAAAREIAASLAERAPARTAQPMIA